MAALPPAQIANLKAFCELLRGDPQLVLKPELAFFVEFLQDFQVPAPDASAADVSASAEPAEEGLADEEEHDPEVIAPDELSPDQVMGDASREPNDAEMEQASEAKMAASDEVAEGNFESAITHYGTAIKLMPSALVYANRANAYLKVQKPCAAIKDCDAALAINPDSAKAFKMRGKANRMLGRWEAAAKDLGTGQNIDYDDSLYELQKLVEEKAKHVAERRAVRAGKGAPAPSTAAATGMPGTGMPGMGMPGMPGMGMPGMPGMGGMPGGMPPDMMQKLMSNPKVMSQIMNPKVMAAMQEVMANPAAAAKYQNDPDMQELFQVFQQTMAQ